MNIAIIGFDPGVTSGVAVLHLTDDSVECVAQLQWGDPDTVWQKLHALARKLEPQVDEVIIVSEQFDKRPGVINPDFTPKFINRDIDNNIHDFKVVYQIPSAAKNLVKPPGPRNKSGSDQLKRFKMYGVGKPHANDATRHSIVYAVEIIKHMPTILLGWPRRDGS